MPTPAMHVRDWFRPPRQLMLVFLVVAVASTTALGWLTWELLAEDRAAEQQRRHDDRERAADVAAVAVERQLATLEQHLEPGSSPASVPGAGGDLPAGAILVSRMGEGFEATPRGGLLYQPEAIPAALPSSPALTAAERLELVDADLDRAARAYAALATDHSPALRATALARVARVERKRRQWSAALAAYDRLAALGNTGVDGLPALLVARIGRVSAFEEQSDQGRLRDEAARLQEDLRQGRLHLTKAQYRYYASEIRRWLGTDRVADADATSVAEALSWLWEHRRETPIRGRRLVATQNGAALAVWRSSERHSQYAAVILGPLALRALVGAAIAGEFSWALTDPEGRSVHGDPPPARDSATRAAAATGLPWTIHVFSSAPPAGLSSPRQTLLVAVLLSVGALLVAGWYFIWRGISREVRVSRLQSDFVAAVSHEFRTPLTSLRHLADLLATDRVGSDERRRRSHAMLVSEADRLGRLVEGLLDFGRLQEGRTAFRFEAGSPVDLVRAVVEEFERRLDPSGHRIEVTTEVAPGVVMADREALGRVIWNLLDNAVKYSPRARRVEVRVTNEPAAGRLVITVRDEGFGIPAAELRGIFDRFVRGAEAKARRIGGTGIGLAMSREIVLAHGGDITVTSQVGVGSVFTVALPMRVAADVLPSLQVTSSS